MSGKNKEKIMRTAADVREEMEAWRKKLQHAEERRCELLARWHSIDEMKRGLLAEFVERIEDDIIWMGNEIALCECELMGREDDSPTSPEDTAYRRGVAATHPEDVGQPTEREDYPSVGCADSSPDKGSQGEPQPRTRDSAQAMAWAEPDKGSQGEAELCVRDTKADQED